MKKILLLSFLALCLCSAVPLSLHAQNTGYPSAPGTVNGEVQVGTNGTDRYAWDATNYMWISPTDWQTKYGKPAGTQTGNPGARTGTQTGNPGADPAKVEAAKKAASSNITLQVRLKNPLCSDPAKSCTNDIESAIGWFVNTLLKIALPFIVIFFIWSGFRFILARGNPTAIADAKKMFWWTIIGTLLILGAWTITNAIIGTVNSISS